MTLDQLKLAAITILVVGNALLGWLWQHEVKTFSEYRGAVEAAGRQAEEDKKRVENEHEQTVKEISGAWETSVEGARRGAVVAYCRTHACGVPGPTNQVPMPGDAPGAQGADAPGQEQLAQSTCKPDEQFIRDCSEDALTADLWFMWATKNHLTSE